MSDANPLDLTILGSGNAFAPSRCWSGFLVNGRYLFDAPPTALYSLKKGGLSPAAIDTILVSHFHADHFFGLPFLLLEYAYETVHRTDLTIVGPAGIEERLKLLLELGYPGLLERIQHFRLRFVEVENGSEGTVNGLNFSAIEVVHGGEALRSYGYRSQIDGRVLSYTGDSQYCDQLVDLGRGADVFVTDCTYSTGRGNPEHMSVEEVRELQEKLGGQTEFVLTHIGGSIDASKLERAVVAEDGARLRF